MFNSNDLYNNDKIKFECIYFDLMNLLFEACRMYTEEACDMAISLLDTTTTTLRRSFELLFFKLPYHWSWAQGKSHTEYNFAEFS